MDVQTCVMGTRNLTTDSGSNHNMLKFRYGFTVVILVLGVPVFASTKSIKDKDLLDTPIRGVSNYSKHIQFNPFVLDLMHPYHIDSPYAQLANFTSLQKIQLLADNSHKRWKYFANKIYGRDITVGMEHDFVSPIHFVENAYLVPIALGTPRSEFSLMMDTGSALTSVQCLDGDDLSFKPSESSSYVVRSFDHPFCRDHPFATWSRSPDGECIYSFGFGDRSSIKGFLAIENFHFVDGNTNREVTIEGLTFGCSNKIQGHFNGAAGLMGLAPHHLSLVAQMSMTLFSYCLPQFKIDAKQLGRLRLGSLGNTQGMGYTPLVLEKAFPFYYLNLVGIVVDDVPVKFAAGALGDRSSKRSGFIIDSGVAFSILEKAIYGPFRKAIAARISYPRSGRLFSWFKAFDLCYSVANVENIVYPTVIFKFEDLDVTLPAANAFIRIGRGDIFCLGFMSQARISLKAKLSFFGALQQQTFELSFESGINHRVGFAQRLNCDK